MASARAQAASVAAGRCSPAASKAAPPTSASVKTKRWPKAAPTASRQRTACAHTSGPMPSPEATAISKGGAAAEPADADILSADDFEDHDFWRARARSARQKQSAQRAEQSQSAVGGRDTWPGLEPWAALRSNT